MDEQGKAIYDVVESHHINLGMSVGQLVELYPRCNQTVRQCECMAVQLRAVRARRLGENEIPLDVARYTFADFEKYPDAVYWARAMAAGESLIDADGNEKYGVLLSGPYGTGKTTLGSLIYLERQKVLGSAVWAKCITLLKRLQATYNEGYNGQSQDEIIEEMATAPFLMLDELGNANEAERGAVFSRDRNEHILRILDYRAMQKKPTVLTNNLTIDQHYTYFDPAIVSRIRGLCHAVWMGGNDNRTGEPQR